MSKMPLEFEAEMEETYDSLISLIENNQGRLCLIIVGCDKVRLRERVIERYEREAKAVKIRPYRIMLGSEPSVRAGLDRTFSQEAYLQEGGEAVFSVLGADTLLWVKLRDEDEQSEIEKFFGYLQWTREGMREFRYPIVLWVSIRILRDMGRRAPDFWSWRKASFQFGEEDERLAVISREPIEVSKSPQEEDEFLPPLDELLQELQELQDRDPNSPNLPTLYSKIAKVYENRVRTGEAKNLVFERSAAIEYFERAIDGMRAIGSDEGEAQYLLDLGDFLESQSHFQEALNIFQKALEVSQRSNLRLLIAESFQQLGGVHIYLNDYQKSSIFSNKSLEIFLELDKKKEIAKCLHNLAIIYHNKNEYNRAIDYFSQSIGIQKEICTQRREEAMSLTSLATCYSSSGQYEKAIALYNQALPIHREFKNRQFESVSLQGLGDSYTAIGDPQKSLEFHKKALEMARAVGERRTEAWCLFKIAAALAKLDRAFEAIQTYQKAQKIFEEILLERNVQDCKDAIRQVNIIIPVKSQEFPDIPKRKK